MNLYRALLFLSLSMASFTQLLAIELKKSGEEQYLLKTLDLVREQKLDMALQEIEILVNKRPDFHLAQLVYGDLLMAKAQQFQDFGNQKPSNRERVDDFKDEAERRLKHYLNHPSKGYVPASIHKLSEQQKAIIVVDVNRSRLYLYTNQNGVPVLQADYYAAGGKFGAVKETEGDRRTPVGVYFISGRLSGGDLPDLYGAGALPINYPNAWDRLRGKTGHGIWLHGVPEDTYSRAPKSSDGCVTLSNDDYLALSSQVDVNLTPVIIAEEIKWKPVADLEISSLSRALEKWQTAWSSMDMDTYASVYASNFYSNGFDRSKWIEHKRKVNQKKDFIHVEISDISIFSDPSEPRLGVVTFKQDYQSSNYEAISDKRQYWYKEDDGQWRIIVEANL